MIEKHQAVYFDWYYGQKFKLSFDWIFRKSIQLSNYMRLIELGYNKPEAKRISRFTHVGFVVDIEGKEILIAESVGNGGANVYRYKTKFINDKIKEGVIETKHYKRKLNDKKIQNVLNQYSDNVSYGFSDIARIFISFIFKQIPFSRFFAKSINILPIAKIFINSASDKAQICTEFLHYMTHKPSNYKINIAKEYNKEPSLLMPAEMYVSKYHK